MYKTDKEILIGNSIYTFKMRKLLRENSNLFFEVAEYLPYFVHTNERLGLQWAWGNKKSFELFNFNEIPVYKKIVQLSEPVVHNTYIKQISLYDQTDDEWKLCPYFQFMNTNSGWKWIHTVKLIGNSSQYVNFSFFLENSGLINLNFKKLLDLGKGNERYWLRFSSLTKSEKLIMRLISSGLTTYNVSEILSISQNTVRKHRENINRKLEINTINELLEYNKIIGLRNHL